MYSEDLLHWIEEFVFYEIRRITRTANLLLSVRRGCLCSKRCLLWVIQIGFTSHGDRVYTPIGIISISRRWRLFHRKGLSLSPIVGGIHLWRMTDMTDVFRVFSRVRRNFCGAESSCVHAWGFCRNHLSSVIRHAGGDRKCMRYTCSMSYQYKSGNKDTK